MLVTRVPVWVPRPVNSTTTWSPDAMTRSTVTRPSGNPSAHIVL